MELDLENHDISASFPGLSAADSQEVWNRSGTADRYHRMLLSLKRRTSATQGTNPKR
jgi:hypothetical protein